MPAFTANVYIRKPCECVCVCVCVNFKTGRTQCYRVSTAALNMHQARPRVCELKQDPCVCMCVCLISNTSRATNTHGSTLPRPQPHVERGVHAPGALTPHTRHGTHGGGDLADFSRESDLVASRTCGDGGLCEGLARAYGRGVGYALSLIISLIIPPIRLPAS